VVATDIEGATWDLQPEKLDFSQFHRKPFRGTPKHLPHIDREGRAFLVTEPPDSRFRRQQHQRPPGGERKIPNPQQPQVPQHQQQQQQQAPPQQQKPANQQQQNEQQQGGPAANARHPRHQHRGGSHVQQYQGHGGQRQGPPHHGYSQNRRWHHSQRGPGEIVGGLGLQGGTARDTERGGVPTGDCDRGVPPTGERVGPPPARQAKETDSVKEEASNRPERERPGGPSEGPPGQAEVQRQSQGQSLTESDRNRDGQLDEGCPKVSLLQSSKERLRRRLKDKEEAIVAPAGPQRNRMDRLLEILNSMRNNSAGVDDQLSSFMEEAQTSAQSEETLSELVGTIYSKALSDRSFAATAAKLCDKMALFMVEGTKFRSLLLNMLQKDFSRREELQASDVERWLGFITFLCEVFGTMRSSAGEPFRVLVCPIYTCLRELLESPDVKEDAVLCCSMELQSTGRLLEEQLPEMMTELLAAARDKMLCPAESRLTRSLLMEVIELHAHQWTPLEDLTTQYYNRTIQKLTTA
uniref:CBP80/20-dependent translation initiation factor n=1 Tax=Esox lucius TaxID=8010 RepID=A0A3P8ZR28_ESOLU